MRFLLRVIHLPFYLIMPWKDDVYDTSTCDFETFDDVHCISSCRRE